MKNFIPKYGIKIFVLSISLCFNTLSQTVIDSEDFESNWGIWNDGGGDCNRTDSSTPKRYFFN